MRPSRRQFLLASAAAGAAVAGCTDRTDRSGTPTEPSPDAPTDAPPVSTPTLTGPARRTARQVGAPPLAVAGRETVHVAAAGVLRALGAADGRERWRRSFGRVRALLRADDGLLSLSADGTVRRHATDGGDRWTASLGGDGRSLARSGDGVVALGSDGTVASFALADGGERWRASVDGVVLGVAAADRTAYVATGEAVVARSLADGGERWRRRPGTEVLTSPTVLDAGVAVGVRDPGATRGAGTPTPSPTDAPARGVVVAVAPDGSAAWSASVEGAPAWIAAAPDGPLVGYRGFRFEALSRQPQVSGLAADGRERWRRVPVPFDRAAAVTRGVAVLVDPAAPEVRLSDEERVRRGQTALRTGSGETVWTRKAGAAAVAAAGEVVVTVADGTVSARGALSGTERWTAPP